MGSQAAEVLSAAAGELVGPVVRTAASVIGKRAGESVIVATTGFGYTVSALVGGLRLAFIVRPRGWLRKSLAVAGVPPELVAQVLDADALARLAPLDPVAVELGATSLRLELRYRAPADVLAAVDWVGTIARRARVVDGLATATGRTPHSL